MNVPLVSVVVPLYNYQKYITYCIKSILKQDYDNFEIIIVDDCSNDNSYSMAKRFKASNIRVIRLKKNYGYSKAKNEGIIASKGELITILDADDMMTKKSISRRVKALLDNKVEFVHANAIAIYDDTSLGKAYSFKKLVMYNKENRAKKKPALLGFPTAYEIHAQTVLVVRELYEKFGLYDERLRSSSDREMWWRFFGRSEKDKTKVKRIHIEDAVAYYRYHKKSMTRYRVKHKTYDKKVRELGVQFYNIRKKQGINNSNTRMLI